MPVTCFLYDHYQQHDEHERRSTMVSMSPSLYLDNGEIMQVRVPPIDGEAEPSQPEHVLLDALDRAKQGIVFGRQTTGVVTLRGSCNPPTDRAA
mmetsp:Transcript_28184/g.86128  ORF Transcript_28184/g.86128 Transcript_28184/m.86128 type:complete len:94 (-) Transcript_28184:900-1181(-)|eukprot:scaffold319173_cov35-Tisochrysis_lutea.AAC.3